MSPWKRNVWPIWISQFLSIMGFAFAMPFAPYFMQELGVPECPELYRLLAIWCGDFVVGGILYLLLAVAILVVAPRIDARGESKG